MYLPSYFREDRLDVLHEFIERQHATPWPVGDAPEPYVQAQLRAIVGFEIAIRDVVGKFKASQNRSDADRARVTDALKSRHATDVDELVRPPR